MLIISVKGAVSYTHLDVYKRQGVLYGAIDFYKTARKFGIRPILGCELYVSPRTRHDKVPHIDDEQYHLVLLAKNETGYRNLARLSSIGFTEGHYYKPCLLYTS